MNILTVLRAALSAAFFFACSGAALAQTGGLLSQGQVLGNFDVATGPSKPTSLITFPLVSGNIVCLNGTTGRLQDCGISPSTVAFTVGSTVVAGGTNKGLLYNNAGVLGNLATGNNGVLVTSGAGVPSISSTLPSGLAIPSPTITGGSGAFTSGLSFILSQNGPTSAVVSNVNAGTAVVAVWTATNSSGSGSFGVAGPNVPGILQNRAYVDAQPGLGGIALNNEGANPIVFGISNTEVGRFTGTGGLTLSPNYQSANIANAALFASVPNRTIGLTPTYNGFVFAQGTPITAIKQGGQDSAGLQQTLMVSNSLAAGDAKAGIALAAYSESNCADPCNTIAIFGQAQANVAGGSIFAGNLIAQNIADNAAHGLDANYMAVAEFNPNKWRTAGGVSDTVVSGNHFYGLNACQGGGNHLDEIGSCIVINNSAFPAPTRWAKGIEIVAGAAITGVSIGQLALGSNQPSQALQFLSKDAGGTERLAQYFSDANGSLYESPSSNAAIIKTDGNGNVLAQFETPSVIGGNTGFQLNQVSAIGVLKTSATGVVSSSLTLPSGLSAATLTLTGGIVSDSLLHTNIAAPGTPASGKDIVWTDSTDLRLHDKNASGVIGTTVVADTGASNQFLTAISAAGAISKAQPAFSNISGQFTLAQFPNIAANTVLANATSGSTVPTAFAMPSCSTAGSALNYTTSTGIGCNTSITAADVANAPVIAKVLTGYVSGAGTVSAADSILSAFQKINGNDALKAPIASPTFTGTPAAPTAAVDTNTTQLATTAMVLGQAASATPLIDGTAAAGTSTRYARGDHIHPTDTSRAALVSPSFTTPSLGVATATSINGVTIDNTAWTAYTPTITGGGGSCGACSITATGRSKQLYGKTMIAQATVAITAIGSWTGALIATLPATSSTNQNVGTCFESSVTGKSGAAFIPNGTPTTFSSRDAAAGSWWVNGYIVNCTVTYELP